MTYPSDYLDSEVLRSPRVKYDFYARLGILFLWTWGNASGHSAVGRKIDLVLIPQNIRRPSLSGTSGN